MSSLLVVGLDGLEPSLVRRWRADLPQLSALLEEGRWGPLRSTLPFATFPAWTSFLTGVNPGAHGVFDFAHSVPGTYDVSFGGAARRRRPTFARLASEAGLRVACVGFPGTYPPEPLNGVAIGGFDSPVAVSIDDSFVHPAPLAAELRRRFGRYVFADFAETRSWVPGWHRRAARKLMRGLERRARIASWLLAREPWDLFMVHFGESDTAAHHFWAMMDEGSPRHPGGVDPELASVLRRVYMRLDRALESLIQQAGPEATVMVASDHGFGGAGDKVLHLNRWLAQQGWLRFVPSPGPGQRALGLGTQAALAVLPGRAQEKLWRAAGPWAGRAEARRRFAGIDWSGTLAFSEELSYHPSVRLNLKGQHPQGQVAPEQADALLEEIRQGLLALRDPWSGQPVLEAVHRREEIYQGEAVAEAPELILELALDEGYSYNCLSSQGPGALWRRLEPSERLGAKGAGMNGTHRRDGFWLLAGPGAAPRRARARMEDMAPTALSVLGLEPPAWMEGRSQHRPAGQARRALPRQAEALRGQEGDTWTQAQQAVLEDRLRRLGYL